MKLLTNFTYTVITISVPLIGFQNWEAARLMPVILATQEAEIRKNEVWSQPGQIVFETLFQKHPLQKGLLEWLKV
jgi:hypothetical protein